MASILKASKASTPCTSGSTKDSPPAFTTIKTTTETIIPCKTNKNKAKIFVSIHRNSAEKTANGIEIWLDKNKEKEDTELAENILNELKKQEIQTDRGIKYGTIKGENTNYYVLGNTNMPSCLVELGFITNEKDNNLLDKNIENYANAIASGILKKVKE